MSNKQFFVFKKNQVLSESFIIKSIPPDEYTLLKIAASLEEAENIIESDNFLEKRINEMHRLYYPGLVKDIQKDEYLVIEGNQIPVKEVVETTQHTYSTTRVIKRTLK